MTAKAAAITEAAVKFVKQPTATGGAKKLTIAGSVDVAGYVYCAVSKTAARRMLNTTNATNTTAKPTTAVAKEVVTLQSSSTAAKYNIQRFEAKAAALAFSMVFSGLAEGKSYSWMCEATSLSPVNAAFRTALVKGSTSTSAAPAPVTTGDSALWSSLFAAILMIAAVFFY
jgi:hypothetical protein